MKQIFKKILIEIDKLPVLDKKSLLNINTYQLEVLSKMVKSLDNSGLAISSNAAILFSPKAFLFSI